MLVCHRMTQAPITVPPQDTLATAQAKMTAGRFRHLPVVDDGALVGMLTDRDLRRHVGMEERTRVRAAMTESLVTVFPTTPVEEATQLLLTHQISGLPVLDGGKLVGIITTSDVLQAFLEMTGSTAAGSIRIDLLGGEKDKDLAEAAKIITDMGGEVLGVGTYREPDSEQPVFYLRLRGTDPLAASAALEGKGYTVLSVHSK